MSGGRSASWWSSAKYIVGTPAKSVTRSRSITAKASSAPLVYESLDWNHGVFVGASMGSEKTAAAEGTVGELRRDPMAIIPFCGYNMGDYWNHWVKMGKHVPKPPRIFNVNWFRKDEQGNFSWPGGIR